MEGTLSMQYGNRDKKQAYTCKHKTENKKQENVLTKRGGAVETQCTNKERGCFRNTMY